MGGVASASEASSDDKSGGRQTFGDLSTNDEIETNADDEAVAAENSLPRR